METIELIKILEQVSKLSRQIETLKPLKRVAEPTRSEKLKELFTSLAKAQGEMKSATLSNVNPYYKSKYADLNELMKTSRPSLSKNGLSVIQQILPNEDGQNILHTLLCHSSGEWISTQMKILPAKSDIQSLGSYITYLRRYSYASLVGITTGEDDDDGEQAVATERNLYAKGTALNTKYNPKENKYESITTEQLEELEYELAEFPDIAEQILEGFKIQSLANMPKQKFLPAVSRIREIKLLRNGK